MTELYIGGIAASLAIVFIVEGLKKAFLPTKWAFLAAAIIGILLGIGASLTYQELSLFDGAFLEIKLFFRKAFVTE